MPRAVTAQLSRQVALVTGGAIRLGREISLALAEAGADVAFSYHRSAAAAARTEADIAALGRRSAAFACDVRDASQVESLLDRTIETLGPIDLLVVNAGVFRRTPIDTATDEDWDWHMATNARAVYVCARRVGLTMRERGGSIVIIADVAGLRPWPSYVPYSASKAAAVSLTQGLALALAPKVRVNAVAPGPVLPPEESDAGAIRRSVSRTLLGRVGSPADVAGAVLYLATAPYVTGVILPVDGGRHLG
jgi:NAD(P)-dependent dehydrogenase (short-subunit alcohol dehydrogenase family)